MLKLQQIRGVGDAWNLEEGISKVIETRVNLGFDFKGKSVKVADIMAELKRKLKLVVTPLQTC